MADEATLYDILDPEVLARVIAGYNRRPMRGEQDRREGQPQQSGLQRFKELRFQDGVLNAKLTHVGGFEYYCRCSFDGQHFLVESSHDSVDYERPVRISLLSALLLMERGRAQLEEMMQRNGRDYYRLPAAA